MKSIQVKRHSSLILLKSCFLSVRLLSRLRFWNGEYFIGILHLPSLLNVSLYNFTTNAISLKSLSFYLQLETCLKAK